MFYGLSIGHETARLEPRRTVACFNHLLARPRGDLEPHWHNISLDFIVQALLKNRQASRVASHIIYRTNHVEISTLDRQEQVK